MSAIQTNTGTLLGSQCRVLEASWQNEPLNLSTYLTRPLRSRGQIQFAQAVAMLSRPSAYTKPSGMGAASISCGGGCDPRKRS